jgi:Histidine kinase-, DNA gyrase B-, and HSP90-like ATPase
LLLGSRAGANRLTVNNEPFDLARLLTAAVEVFRPMSERHLLATDIRPDLPCAYGDPAATDSIVGQLLENALKYSPDGGMVTIGARPLPESGEIEVTVRDEGIGIALADVERVFERFVQGEAGDRRRFGGIGLGLYIVRQLARAQGGDVTAAPGHSGGTVMRLTLRQAEAVAASAGASPPPADHAGAASPNGSPGANGRPGATTSTAGRGHDGAAAMSAGKGSAAPAVRVAVLAETARDPVRDANAASVARVFPITARPDVVPGTAAAGPAAAVHESSEVREVDKTGEASKAPADEDAAASPHSGQARRRAPSGGPDSSTMKAAAPEPASAPSGVPPGARSPRSGPINGRCIPPMLHRFPRPRTAADDG